METFWTVVSGTLVCVVGQIVQRFVLAPIEAQRRLIADIDEANVYFANITPRMLQAQYEGHNLVITTTPDVAEKEIRILAARLRATVWAIPLYRVWSVLSVILTRQDILAASHALIEWSNSMRSGDSDAARARIVKLLRLLPE